jgi:hypothetical protein
MSSPAGSNARLGGVRPKPGRSGAIVWKRPRRRSVSGDAGVDQHQRRPVAGDVVGEHHACAASWPQAASMSRPRVTRTVASRPRSVRTARNVAIASRLDPAYGPPVGL